jgi:hypothetical protein
MARQRQKIKLTELEIPTDYFNLPEYNKEMVCMVLMDSILKMIDQNFEPQYNRIEILNKLLDASIETNIEDETYEVAAVLTDIKKILNG